VKGSSLIANQDGTILGRNALERAANAHYVLPPCLLIAARFLVDKRAVALCRLCVRKTRMLLLDEPTNH